MRFTTTTGISSWFGALLPSQCAICHAWPSQRLCGLCLARFAGDRPRCRTCAQRVPDGVVRCGACLTHPPPLDACVAALDYAYPWPHLIADFKFRRDPSWARSLAGLLRTAPGASALLANADWVVPIPLSPERLAERGFNQAQLLARQVARPGTLRRDLLLRVRHTPAQSGLARDARLRNLARSFAVLPERRSLLLHRKVLLIDDVMTTGATLHHAALAVRAAGASEVSALVLARAA